MSYTNQFVLYDVQTNMYVALMYSTFIYIYIYIYIYDANTLHQPYSYNYSITLIIMYDLISFHNALESHTISNFLTFSPAHKAIDNIVLYFTIARRPFHPLHHVICLS